MPLKITINEPAARILSARAVAMFKQIGDVADKITAATAIPTKADTKAARRNLRMWSAVSFSELLDRIFGR